MIEQKERPQLRVAVRVHRSRDTFDTAITNRVVD